MSATDWRNNPGDLAVTDFLKYSDRIMLNAEKCRLEQFHESRSRADPSNDGFKSTLEELNSSRREVGDLQSSLRRAQYRGHEEVILDELKTITKSITSTYTNMNKLTLPRIASPGPLKPTTLLERAIEKQRMKTFQNVRAKDFGNVDVIKLADGGTRLKLQLLVKSSEGSSMKSKSSGSRKNDLPILKYEHQDGTSRNLPGQPELIRLLFNTEFGYKYNGAHNNQRETNNVLELYGGLEPPLLDGVKRKARRRRRAVCKFCGKSPGCHQKWCIYFEADPVTDSNSFDLVRSNTAIELKHIKTEPIEDKLHRSHTTIEQRQFTRPDLPDYSSLHRDVYDYALAISRAKQVFKGACDFTNQSTKPFVFSYFSGQEVYRNDGHKSEMEHIFGKEDADFTKYYSLFVKEKLCNK